MIDLKPCLVLGTGFHHWVLGDSMSRAFEPLTSWDALLLEVANKLGVAVKSPEIVDTFFDKVRGVFRFDR